MNTIVVTNALLDARLALDNLLSNQKMIERISDAGELLVSALKKRQHIYSCGNGGSLCDAMHFAEELTGRFRDNRKPFAATAISDVAHMACVANDFGYQFVFSRYLEACAHEGDVLLAISTSGKSINVIEASKVARKIGMKVILLTGVEDSPLEELADIAIVTSGGAYADRVQELHIKVIHILIELIERNIVAKNYA